MEPQLIELFYVSWATAPITPEVLSDILQAARKNNSSRGVSGLLLYGDSHFMQILEGSEESVNAIFDKIIADPRHTNILTIYKRDVDKRHFDGWAMAHYSMKDSTEELRNSFVAIEKGARMGSESIVGDAEQFVSIFESIINT